MEALEKNNGKKIALIGFSLLILAVVLGPPLSIALFVVAAVMIIIGGRKHKKSQAKAIPLSQKSPKSKILSVIPAVILISLSFIFEKYSGLLFGIALLLFSYSISGIIEICIDNKFPNAKTNWENISSLKKIIISILVIVLAMTLAALLVPIMARM